MTIEQAASDIRGILWRHFKEDKTVRPCNEDCWCNIVRKCAVALEKQIDKPNEFDMIVPSDMELLEAIARGWTYIENQNKVMDFDLAMAILSEVKALMLR